jgi:hypothetical protein
VFSLTGGLPSIGYSGLWLSRDGRAWVHVLVPEVIENRASGELTYVSDMVKTERVSSVAPASTAPVETPARERH